MRTLLSALLLFVTPAVTFANEYRAERFDSRIEVLPGGALRVTETIVLRFEEGTFKYFYRTLPTRRTDGIEFVSASMDGAVLPQGEGPGQVEVRRKEGLRIDWHFPPTGPSTHTFELTYVARGVAVAGDRADTIAWRALPTEHAYTIASSRVEMVLPATVAEPPRIATRRVDNWQESHTDARVVVTAATIAKNGWIELHAQTARGSVVSAPPGWQQRQARHREYRDPSLIAAGLILFAGLALLFGIRQGYDSPPRDIPSARTFSGPPDAAPPAIAGALIRNGRVQLEHAMGALFALAANGAVAIHEGKRGVFGQRHFTVTRGRSARSLAAHEETLIGEVFSAAKGSQAEVPLDRARTHLVRHFSRFKKVVEQEMSDAGLFDHGRRQVRRRFTMIGAALLILGLAGMIPVAVFANEMGGWPFSIPFAVVAVGILALIFGGAHTPLSNDGVRRAEEWRAYQKQLRSLPKEVTRSTWSGARSPADLLPLAVALGLATAWSRMFKDRAAQLPVWFHAASAEDANAGFVAFVGHGGTGAGGGGGGGAAGGGGSGAG